MELLQKVLDLPVIVQGALGSALFWLVLELGQWVARQASSTRAKLGKQDQTATQIALASVLEKSPEARRFAFQGMVHGALHYTVKALIFLAMGLSIQPIVPVVGTVGILAALIFLFRALAYVPNFDRWPNEAEMQKTYIKLKGKSEV
ncbi:MAG: hypothetical protein O9274_02230 [Limnobacter sp.]|uniref:hypothetical protein n=1 Tax=Limnobacter sp. TaxID=2003368 RepID=UPI0022C2AB2E|nr:hypothetical protein [Limnobacter sp.]MCZ8014493.1 hypothetical protein [Limnobacter sp.]